MALEYLNNKRFEEIIEKFRIARQDKIKQFLLLEEVRDTYDRKKKRGVICKKDSIPRLTESLKLAEINFIIAQKDLANAFTPRSATARILRSLGN